VDFLMPAKVEIVLVYCALERGFHKYALDCHLCKKRVILMVSTHHMMYATFNYLEDFLPSFKSYYSTKKN
jgi:hypothetical protein